MKLKQVIGVLCFLLSSVAFAQESAIIYGDAMNDFARGAYSSAYQRFIQYTNSPDVEDGQIPAAHYFAGECLYNIGDFSGAIFEYSKVVDSYKLCAFREDALFKLGLVYYRINSYAKSRERFFQFLGDYSESEYKAQAQYWIAEDFLAENVLDEALDFFSRSASDKTNNPYVSTSIYKQAGIYELQGNFQKAVEKYDTLLTYFRSSPFSTSAQYRIGYSYFKLKMYDNALIELSSPELGQLTPERKLEASYMLGASYFSSAEYQKADSIFTSMLAGEVPDSLKRQLTYALGWCKFQEKSFTDAQKLFNTLAKGSDSLAQVSLYWKGESQRYQGKQNEAVKTFEDYLKKYPGSPLTRAAQYEIGVIYFEQQQFQKARSFLLNASTTGESDLRARVFTILGELELNRENTKSAVDYFNSALQVDSISRGYRNRALLGKGIAEYKDGNYKAAIKSLISLEKSAPAFEIDKINFVLGECYFAEDKYTDALNRYKRVSLNNEEYGSSALYGAAYCSYNLKEYAGASFQFADFVKLYPHDVRISDAHLRLADSYLATRKYAEASAEYKEISRGGAKNGDYALYQYGQALFKNGKLDEAVGQFRRLAEKYPKSQYTENGLYLIGWMKFQAGKAAEAIEQYQYVLTTYPKTKLAPQVYYAMGDCYYNAGNYDSAIVCYSRVVETYPNAANAYDAINGLQLSYTAKGDVQSAADIIEKYSTNKKAGFADQLYLKKGDLYFSQGAYQDARDSYTSFLSLFPESKYIPKALYWVAKCSELLGEIEPATEKYAQVFEQYPKSDEAASAVIEWGKILLQQNRFDEALTIYDNALDKLKETSAVPELLYRKGLANSKKGDDASAFDAFDELVTYHDGTLFADKGRVELGVIELNAKRYANAVKYFQQLAAKRTDEIGATAQYYLGVVNQEEGKLLEAITQYVRTLNAYASFDDWVTKSYLRLGECYDKLKDIKKAREMYKTVVDKHKTDEYGKEAQAKLRKLK